MPTLNYRELPKVKDSLSHLYLEYGKLEQTKYGIEFSNKKGSLPIPIANLRIYGISRDRVCIPRTCGGEPTI